MLTCAITGSKGVLGSKLKKKLPLKFYEFNGDITNKNKDDVFVFNGWMFSSSPSIAPFDHPVYDIWLVGCY